MSAAHPRCAAAGARARVFRASRPRASPPSRAPLPVSRPGRPSATVMSASRRARDAAADVGLGGDGRGMRWCDCAGEGVLVSLTKAQKRARRLARDDARPLDPAPPPPRASRRRPRRRPRSSRSRARRAAAPASSSSTASPRPPRRPDGRGCRRRHRRRRPGARAPAARRPRRGVRARRVLRGEKQGYGLTMQRYPAAPRSGRPASRSRARAPTPTSRSPRTAASSAATATAPSARPPPRRRRAPPRATAGATCTSRGRRSAGRYSSASPRAPCAGGRG